MVRKSRRYVRIVSLFAALALSPVLTAHADPAPPFKTMDPGKLKVCLYWGFAPFASRDADGNWEGWDVDYLKAFAKASNIPQFEVVPRDFKNIWLEPGKGSCDIAGTGISDTRERRKNAGPGADWTNTYYYVLRTFLVRTADFTRLTKVEDLSGKKAIVTKDSTANSDLCYRMKEKGLYPCAKADDHPCNGFVGLEGYPETTREKDKTCVYIEYPWEKDEKNAGDDVAAGRNSDPDPGVPFTYGGGYGSIQALVCNCQGPTPKGQDCPSSPRKDQDLATVWPHCNMTNEGEVAEPFSFVVSSADTHLAHALNCYINSHPYQGTPIPDIDCPKPGWTPAPDKACL
ncbi:MAG TPA: transporter substrate-binding domain-containing protein [Thermoanaerobaculia bacterium]|jgi:hypothetical protein|nr:transporter substrate-binding domain-containing protein [Thermoanaerobaculia bacterium]